MNRLKNGRIASAFLAIWIVFWPSQASAETWEVNQADFYVWNVNGEKCLQNSPMTAVGCYRESGDRLLLGDAVKDGKSVGIWWKTDYGRSGLCIHSRGKDTDPDSPIYEGGAACNKNYLEDHYITFKVGECAAGCNKLKNWSNWSGLATVRT
jgi:hypothetical protein